MDLDKLPGFRESQSGTAHHSDNVYRRASKAGERLSFPHNDNGKVPSYVEELNDVKELFRDKVDTNRQAAKARTMYDWFAYFLPFLGWLRTYKIKEYLLWDLLAGITVGFMVVPQGMSYATLAGVPAVYGLYGAFLPVMVYSMFGTCKQLGVGPVAVTSLLIGSGIQKLVLGSADIDNPSDPTPEEMPIQEMYNTKVIQLAFLVACLYTGVGVLRLGWLIHFLSHSVITGFTSGAAIIIGLSQVKYILGYSVPRADTLHESLRLLFDNIHKFKWQEFLMGSLMLIWLIALRLISHRVKKLNFLAAVGPISACIIGIVVIVGSKVSTKTINIVEKIPAGLPHPTINKWSPIEGVGPLMGLALVVMVVDLLESTSIARALARKNGYQLVYNQEIVGLGLANFAGALFSSYTTTGSFSRSAVNNASGAKTQLAGFITSIVVMFVLLFLTPVFQKLPYNTIGAIIIVGVGQLIEFGHAIFLFKTHLRDFLVWLAAFLCTLFLGAELGLGISIGLALLIVILESAFPHTAVLGQLEKSTVYRSTEQYPAAERTPGVLAVRLDAPVYFANVSWMRNKIEEYEDAASETAELEFVILDLTPVTHVDAMGASWFEEVWLEHKSRGIQLVLSNPNPRVLRILDRTGFLDKLGREWIFVRVHDAVVYCKNHTRLALEGGGGDVVVDAKGDAAKAANGATTR